MAGVDAPLYRHAGGGMLRAAVLPLGSVPARWPTVSDSGSCRSWLREVWALPGFAEAVRGASSSLASTVEAVLGGQVAEVRQVRRVTVSVLRYLLRSVGRPTPFGLFAGAAPVRVGEQARVRWGGDHRVLVRADTVWLDEVVERLETSADLLPLLDVVVCDLVVDRGGRIEVPRGPGRVTVRHTAVVRLVRDAATAPISVVLLSGKVAEAFPDVPAATIHEALRSLVAEGVLITSLRPPMTVTDPLGFVIDVLDRAAADAGHVQVGGLAEDLRGVQRLIHTHNAAETQPSEQARLRAALVQRMRRLSSAGRTPLAGDLQLDCKVTVPAGLATEMAHAVTALLRLTRQPRPDPAWNDWCREFWERYGTGTVVPVTEAVHPDAGISWPAGFPGSVLADPGHRVSRRDEQLLRLAWDALAAGRGEVVLTDDIIAAITAEEPVDPRRIPAHVELGARVHATTLRALEAGEYTFTVHPAWAFGTLTSRFGPTVARAGLDTAYAGAPSAVERALPVQMSFPPLFPHAENVARVPAWLPYVLPLGEHRTGDDPTLIRLDDVGIVAVADGLHLVCISRRRVIEPQVFHALALAKQAPPLARFLATLTRGFLARYTEFDWGPAAAGLTYLPRVRYRRAILAPATWRITAADHAAMLAEAGPWEEAFGRWRRRWNCPDVVKLHDDHRSLRLDLTAGAHQTVLCKHLAKHGHARLTETESLVDTSWIGGHVHEIVMPFTRATPPAPNLVGGPQPVVRNSTPVHRPAAPDTSWLYTQIFTHPERIDDVLRSHLPRLLATLGGDPVYWFARYRSVRETDHLRLRIRTTSPDEYATVALAVGAWGQQLCNASAASRWTFAAYHPEIGRYGAGPAMDAAEAVFAADSHAVALALRLLPPRVVHPAALAAIGLVDIADAFHTDPQTANGWLLDDLAGKAAARAERAVTDQARAWAMYDTLPDGTGLPAAVMAGWQARRAALARYRRALPADADPDQILSALLHMHHNRARGVDRADEAVCLRHARQAALARRARTVGGTR
jgi:lantibiotic biosynthesis protein